MRRKNISVLLLVCCLLFVQVGTCLAATKSITEQELTRLDQIFNQLESNSTMQDQELQKQKIQLQNLKAQLTLAENSTQAAQSSLEKANQSLEQSAKEVRKIKAQRTAAWVVAVGVLVYALVKK